MNIFNRILRGLIYFAVAFLAVTASTGWNLQSITAAMLAGLTALGGYIDKTEGKAALLVLLCAGLMTLPGCISAQVFYPLPNGGKAVIGFSK